MLGSKNKPKQPIAGEGGAKAPKGKAAKTQAAKEKAAHANSEEESILSGTTTGEDEGEERELGSFEE